MNASQGLHYYLKVIILYIKALGIIMGTKKDLAYLLIQKEINMQENGKMINLMEKEDSSLQREIIMKDFLMME